MLALAPEYRASFAKQLRFIESKHPPYSQKLPLSRWEEGLDCSGYIYLAGKWGGIPGIKRTRAYRMALGLDGWSGSEMLFTQAIETDLAFWTWKTRPDRVNGHVGAFIMHQNKLQAAHAGSRGVTIAPFKYALKTDLSKVWRLSIGGY